MILKTPKKEFERNDITAYLNYALKRKCNE